jgi:Phytanoyl-CoA dioxygenase (PhyH)
LVAAGQPRRDLIVSTVFFNPSMDEASRRQCLYEGQLVVYSASPGSLALIAHAQTMIVEAFGALDPQTAQYDLPVERFAAILAELKPGFIHHPRSKELICALLSEFGCDLQQSYFDVPRLRTSTSDDYLTTGISYAFHPHRDTWYSAPFSQINWWLPIFAVVPENAMAFHPRYWSQPVRNGSRRYDYYEWNRTSRQTAAQHIKSDTRDQPKPEEPIELDPQVRVVPEPGGVLLFSGNQLHSTVPNTSGCTRFSIDFRTVNLKDVLVRREAPNVDSECTGTTIRDFLRAADLQRIPEDVAVAYERTATATM